MASRSLPLLALLLLSVAPLPAAAATRLLVQGETDTNGIFDPSVEYDPSGAVGWLAYSSIYGEIQPWGPHVETRLARSLDSGASWSFVRVVNPSQTATLIRPGMPDLPGVWNYEVASLAYDPDDPGAEWKLFAYRVFRKTEDDFVGEQNLPAYSWICYRTASDPAGPWSPEVALLSSGPFPPAPYDTVQVAIDDLDASLANAGLVVYSEPGAFYRDGVLYLSLTALTMDGPNRIVLLASDDHGAGWRYVGTPLSNADAPAVGYLSFDGSAIAEDAGRVFLLVTPQSTATLHDGTLVFEFADLASGSLVKAADVPVVRAYLPPRPGLPPDRRGGQADFHEHNRVGGLLQPSLQVGDYPVLFQIFSTGRELAASPVPGPGGAGLGAAALAFLFAGIAGTRARRAGAG